MTVIDAQVHVWEPERPDRPWPDPEASSSLRARAPVDHDTMIEIMDGSRVAGAVLVTPSLYGWDNGYALSAALRHPGRFRVVGRVDPAGPDVSSRVSEFARHPAAAGIRVIARRPEQVRPVRAGVLEPLLRAADRWGLAVCVLAPGHLDEVRTLARTHAGVQFLVDHLGLALPPVREAGAGGLREVLGLAALPNVVIKLTGAPALSAQPFPFPDLWPLLHRFADEFGPDRLVWGSDWTRVHNATYDEGVRWFRDNTELPGQVTAAVMGGTARTIFGWPPANRPVSAGQPPYALRNPISAVRPGARSPDAGGSECLPKRGNVHDP